MDLSEPEHAELLAAARNARSNAYAPYSNFAVGAAVQASDGSIHTGANIENASFSLTLCAERSALAAAASHGYREFSAIAIAVDDDHEGQPCGACRQFMAEFNPDMTVIYTVSGDVRQTTVRKLLADPFLPGALHG